MSFGQPLQAYWIPHPWTLLASQIIVNALVVGFAKPSSKIRPLALTLYLISTSVYVMTAKSRVDNIFQVNWGGSQAVLATYQYIDTAIVSRWDFDFAGPEPKAPSKKHSHRYGRDTVWNRLKFGFYAASSFRNCGTAFEARGLRPFRRSDPAYIPSRAQFLASTALRVVACYLVLDTLTSLGDSDKQAILFAESRIPLLSRLNEVTPQELVERLICSLTFWVSS